TNATGWIEKKANEFLAAGLQGVKRVSYSAARKASTTHEFDFCALYVKELNSIIDMDAIRGSQLKLAVDPLGGAGLNYWERLSADYKLPMQVVNKRIDPTFSFMHVDWDGKIRMDCSSPYSMAGLVSMKGKFDVAVANDTDHDRHGIVTPSGLMNPNHY